MYCVSSYLLLIATCSPAPFVLRGEGNHFVFMLTYDISMLFIYSYFTSI